MTIKFHILDVQSTLSSYPCNIDIWLTLLWCGFFNNRRYVSIFFLGCLYNNIANKLLCVIIYKSLKHKKRHKNS